MLLNKEKIILKIFMTILDSVLYKVLIIVLKFKFLYWKMDYMSLILLKKMLAQQAISKFKLKYQLTFLKQIQQKLVQEANLQTFKEYQI